MRETTRAGAIVTAAACALVAACVSLGPGASAHGGGLRLVEIGSFSSPVYVASAPGADKLVFIVEQPGTIRVMRDGKTLDRPFLNISSRVKYGGEQGLLSMAFDPGYAHNRRFYVYYVNEKGNVEVDTLRRKRKSATRAEGGSRAKVIEIPHPTYENHNGGQLQFGPDGLLYIGTGDGGSGGDPDGNAQSKSILLGKLLRIDPRKRGGYSVPRSNPFAKGKGKGEIYATGLRNPFRFSFDSRTGDIWIGDVGQDEWEEIDHVGRTKLNGTNFGWDRFEGDHVYEGDGTEPGALQATRARALPRRWLLRRDRRLRRPRQLGPSARRPLRLLRLLRWQAALARPIQPGLQRRRDRPRRRLARLVWARLAWPRLHHIAQRPGLPDRAELAPRGVLSCGQFRRAG